MPISLPHDSQATTPGMLFLMETLKRVCLDVEAAKNCAAFKTVSGHPAYRQNIGIGFY